MRSIKVNRVHTDGSANQTGPLMRQMVYRYWSDMLPYAHLSLPEVFTIIKNIPYREDPPNEETLMRPYYTMNSMGWGGDCDDKCIALASYAYMEHIPFRFIAIRRRGKKQLHHVLCELYIMNRWLHADPTYSFNVLGRPRLDEHYAQRVVI